MCLSRKKPRVSALGREAMAERGILGCLEDEAPELVSAPLLGSSSQYLLLLGRETQEGSLGHTCFVVWWITVQGMEGCAAHPLLCEHQVVLFQRPPGKCGLFLGQL